MRLQKLTIHNIASIEDAVIDFDAEPLAHSEVFLITGKTGAGKSTILDAICLALYANTPRLDNTYMQGETVDRDKEIKIDDPRQLMRRNTGEAFATLTFTGSNSVRYEATWSVARARNKATGNLQGKKWQLKNLDTGYVLTKDKEIADEIQAAVGLEFSQFCRTTMLAQGEFTRFLNSKDKEKAEILEKITGVDSYSKIGKKVFEITAEKQQDWEEAARLVENTKVLDDEEIARHQTSIKEIEEEQKTLRTERDAVEKKRNWLNRDAELTKKVGEATESHALTYNQTKSDEFKAKELLVEQWNDTIDARHWQKELDDAIVSKERHLKVIADAKQVFAELKGGELWLKEYARKTEERLRVLARTIEAEKEKESIYDRVQTLLGLLQTIEAGRHKMAAEEEAVRQKETMLNGELRLKKEAADNAFASAKLELEAQTAKLKRQEEELAAAHLPELRKQKEECQAAVTAADFAKEKWDSLVKERARQEKKRQEIAHQEKFIAKLNDQWNTLKPQIHDADLIVKTKRAALDQQRDSIDVWAKAMRAKLHAGGTCPVCCRKIENEIPHEDELDGLFAVLEQSWKEAEKALDALKDKERLLVAELNSQTRSRDKAKENFANDTALSDSENAVKMACRLFGIHTFDEDTEAALVRLRNENRTNLECVAQKIAAAEAMEKAATESRKETERLRKSMETARKDADEAAHRINECKGSIDTGRTLIRAKAEETDSAGKEVKRILTESRWQSDWNTEMATFRDEVSTAAKLYNDNKKKQLQLEQELRERHTLIDTVSDAMQSIASLAPEWKGVITTEANEVKHLLAKANDLRTTLRSAMDQLKAATATADTNKAKLAAYFAENNRMTPALLAALGRYPTVEITAIGNELSKLREDLVARKTILEQILLQQKEHIAQKPEIEEDETSASLSASITQIDEQINALGEKKGALNLLLRQDEDNKKRQSRLLADAEAKKEIYRQWSRMNQLIGDATGSKFRKIAQSYVLTSLIHAANSYMHTLTDRYTLKVGPGTFVILLEDAYQGFVCRAASTLSGGEGFLVSLALALALSDIGQTLSVDTLFIDEGFGTLSGEPLQKAIDTLRTLHTKGGRHVGIISHVEELQERIPVQIQVLQEGNNSSSKVNIVPDAATGKANSAGRQA